MKYRKRASGDAVLKFGKLLLYKRIKCQRAVMLIRILLS